MKENDDILKKAVEHMKQTLVPGGPPKDLVDTTIKELNQVASELSREQIDKQVVFNKRFMINNIFKLAAVVFLSISIGYSAGRFSRQESIDIQQVRETLEPEIRKKLFDEVSQYVQIELANNYVVLREELTEQYVTDLKLVALDVLNASGTITNNLLEEMIQTIATAQQQNRQWLVAALQQNELNRIQDKNQLGNAFLKFASRTDNNIAAIATYLTDSIIDKSNINEFDNQNNYNQGENYENLIQNN